MMKNLLRSLLLISVFLLTALQFSVAQQVTIGAEIRPRFEVQYGYRVPPDTLSDPQIIVSQRTRLNAGYKSDRFDAYLSIQDARIWGDEVLAADIASIGLHEAWGQYNFSKKVGVKAGRMELAYDNKRIITNGEWPQQSRAYDAAVLKLDLNRGWKVDLAGSYNQQTSNQLHNYYALANYKTLDFLWVNKTKQDSFSNYSVSALLMGDGNQSPDTSGIKMRYTFGVNGTYARGKWGINFEAYGQSGETREVNQSGIIVPDSFETVEAYMFSVGPFIRPAPNLELSVNLDYLSGSDALDSTEMDVTRMFNPVFGANDRYYGKIDWFVNMPADTRNAGLIDAYLILRYNWKNWNFRADYHYFWLQNQVEDVENPGTALEKGLGSELDISAIRDITKELNVNTGVAVFFPTRSMEFVKTTAFSQLGSPEVTGVYVWLQLTYKPVFFSSKPKEEVKM